MDHGRLEVLLTISFEGQFDLFPSGDAARAIMPVHLYGTACDMNTVLDLASRHNLKVIEDAAQGIGVLYDDRHVGSIGDVGCFSFFADKTITMGEGGFVACRDPSIYERLRLLRNQGRIQSGTFLHPAIGFNFRVTDIQAAIGRVQLAKLPAIAAHKRELHEAYRNAFSDISSVRVLGAAEHAGLVPFRCVIQARDASGLMAHLSANQVEPRGFFYPLHAQPAFGGTYINELKYPNAAAGHRNGVCLPVHGEVSLEDIARIAALVREHQASFGV